MTERECPFCASPIWVADVTEPERREVGLIYLSAKCVPCNARIDAVGNGLEDAWSQFDRAIARRIGTKPEQWKIKTVHRRRRK